MLEFVDIVIVGFVYVLEWLDGFLMIVDYYEIEIENLILSVNN